MRCQPRGFHLLQKLRKYTQLNNQNRVLASVVVVELTLFLQTRETHAWVDYSLILYR